MFDLVLDLIGAAIDGLRQFPNLRRWLTALTIALLVLTLAMLLIAPAIFNAEIAKAVREIGPALSVALGLLTLVTLSSYSPIKIRPPRLVEFELEDLREERQEIRREVADKPTPDVLDTIRLTLNQMNEYYVINKSQARNSFRFSVFAIVAGLVTLVAGIWYFYVRATPNVELTIISSASGVLIQFIGGAYFDLYRKTLEQLNFFFGQLVSVQDTMLSIRLCDEIDDSAKKIELREKIILELLRRSSTVAAHPVSPT